MVCSSFIWFLKSDPDPAQSSITQQNDVDVDAHCSPTLIVVVSCSASLHAATFKPKDEKGHFGLVPWPEHSNSFDNESPRVTRCMTPWLCFCVRKVRKVPIFLSKRHLRPHLYKPKLRPWTSKEKPHITKPTAAKIHQSMFDGEYTHTSLCGLTHGRR